MNTTEELIEAAYEPNIRSESTDDNDEVLPSARFHDDIVVTNDLQDFSNREDTEHEGIILVSDGTLHPFEIASPRAVRFASEIPVTHLSQLACRNQPIEFGPNGCLRDSG